MVFLKILYILIILITFPLASESFELVEIDSYSWNNSETSEISVYDEKRNLIFSTNPSENKIDIFSFKDNKINYLEEISLRKYGLKPNSIAINKNSILAVAIENIYSQGSGVVAFFDRFNKYLFDIEVGVMPDMIIFNKKGNELIVANEGEPSQDLSNDPDGSISIIDLNSRVSKTYTFEKFDNNHFIRKIFDVKLSQDLEPEYLTISEDEKYILVSLQENNAIAVFDYKLRKFISIFSLGYKSYELNKIDVNDKDFEANLQNWPIKGLYQPDAIVFLPYKKTLLDRLMNNYYFASANEGDSKVYQNMSEEVRVRDIKIDRDKFNNFSKVKGGLSRLKISKIDADKNNDGKFESLYSFGGRSFSVWKYFPGLEIFGYKLLNDKITLHYDSGDEFEMILSKNYIDNFNTNYSKNKKKLIFDKRSDDKGPEPESLSIFELEKSLYLIISLERSNGFFIYDITDLRNIKYVTFFPITENFFSPEGIKIYYNKKNILFLVSFEESGSIVFYKILKKNDL